MTTRGLKKHRPEEIVAKLRDADAMTSPEIGMALEADGQAADELGVKWGVPPWLDG